MRHITDRLVMFFRDDMTTANARTLYLAEKTMLLCEENPPGPIRPHAELRSHLRACRDRTFLTR